MNPIFTNFVKDAALIAQRLNLGINYKYTKLLK